MRPSKIRKATVSDYPILKEIGMECYDKTVSKEEKSWLTRLLFKRYFSYRKFLERENRHVEIYCLCLENEVVGFYELENQGGLASLYVKCDYHKQGYGKALMLHAIQKAKELKLKEIYLDSSYYARDFYKRLGFKEVQPPRLVLGVYMVAMKMKVD